MVEGIAGGFEKLTIFAYEDPGYGTLAGLDVPNPLSVPINPEKCSLSMGAQYTCDSAPGSSGQSNSFDRLSGVTLSFDLVFDGTGAVAGASDISVADQLKNFRRLVLDPNPKSHRPNYLKLNWGSTQLLKGQTTSLRVEYTLFNPDGSPLRAKVAVSFSGFVDAPDARAAQNNNSPDLTHRIPVAAGDTLPLMCARVYRESLYYVDVAATNGLDGFRRLPAGLQLSFPPLSGSGG
ncbi:MAG: hypothetical protein QOG72_1743 [Sphingomonadales bacterium]|jgi:hypothetical protein|nr:hypothetical protein [Sphingomonadales bacterium]